MTSFTKIQLKQLQQLIKPLNEGISELRTGQEELRTGQEELRTGQEELRTGQEELRTGQEELKAGITAQGKTIQYIKKKLNRTAKTVDIIGKMYNQDIVNNSRRITNIEEKLGIIPLKH